MNTVSVKDTDSIIITTAKGMVIRTTLNNIRVMGRATQGVILMRFAQKSDSVAAAAVLEINGGEEEEEKV